MSGKYVPSPAQRAWEGGGAQLCPWPASSLSSHGRGAGARLQGCPPSCPRLLWALGFPRVHRLRDSTGEEPGEDEGRRATGGLQGTAPGLGRGVSAV